MLTKVYIVKRFERWWTVKKAEDWRSDAFELWCWRGLLTVPWIARRSNQSILKEINPELEGLMLKLKLQYFGPWCEGQTPWKRPWWWERLKAGGEGGSRGWDGLRWHYRLNRHESEQTLGDGEGQGSLVCCSPWGVKELDTTEWLNWTDLVMLSPDTVKIMLNCKHRELPAVGKNPHIETGSRS